MFKVMSFNVRGSHHSDGANEWNKRAKFSLQTIVKADPDLIGFQEFTLGNQAGYEHGLTAYESLLGPRVSIVREGTMWEHVALYWKRDRFTALESGHYFLNETPHQYALSWGSPLGRALNWVRLRDQQTQAEFIVMNTHFCHVSDEARLNSARLICEQTRQRFAPWPVLLMGDFNTPPQSRSLDRDHNPYEVFLAAGFQDTFSLMQERSQPTHTFHGFQGASFADRKQRIDWILHSDPSRRLKAESMSILRDAVPPVYPSDHYPITATFEWPS